MTEECFYPTLEPRQRFDALASRILANRSLALHFRRRTEQRSAARCGGRSPARLNNSRQTLLFLFSLLFFSFSSQNQLRFQPGSAHHLPPILTCTSPVCPLRVLPVHRGASYPSSLSVNHPLWLFFLLLFRILCCIICCQVRSPVFVPHICKALFKDETCFCSCVCSWCASSPCCRFETLQSSRLETPAESSGFLHIILSLPPLLPPPVGYV